MAKFVDLDPHLNYDIIDGETGHWRTMGIQGCHAMTSHWEEGDEAWPTGETEFRGQPVETAA